MSEIGDRPRSYEFGGFFNPSTREISIVRGFENDTYGPFTGVGVNFKPELISRDEQGRVSGLFWHTHPWNQVASTLGGKREVDKNRCLPGDRDNTILMAMSRIEQEEGHGGTPLVSIIGSKGYISITTASGLAWNREQFLSAQIPTETVEALEKSLGIVPPIWIRNLASPGKEDELFGEVKGYYQKKLAFDGSFSSEIDVFLDGLEQNSLLNAAWASRRYSSARLSLRAEMLHSLPDFSFRWLESRGLTTEQVQLVKTQIGIQTQVYTVNEAGQKTVALS